MRGVVPPLLKRSSGPAPSMERSSSSPPPSPPPLFFRRFALTWRHAGEGSSNAAIGDPKRWAGWEETAIPVAKDRRSCVVFFHLIHPSEPDDPFGGRERDLAVVGVGKLSEPGAGTAPIMSYRAHGRFLRLLEAAAGRFGAWPRAKAVAAEASQLTNKSRKEIMEWLTSLVTDPPFYSLSEFADILDGSSLGNHDDDDDGDATFAGSLALQVVPSTFARNNPEEGFAWLSAPVPHFDIRRKHYRSFCLKGTRISVHDFIYIKNSKNDKENHVGYVEDMYEDVEANNMVLARWLDKVDDDHGAVTLPPDVDDREIFLTYGLQDIRVEWVVGLAAVLNSQHFEEFKKMENHINWKPYLCCRQVENGIMKPFDVTQLQGYSSQEIVRTLFNTDANARDKNKTEERGQKRKSDEISDQIVEYQASRNVANDRTVGNHALHIATADENTMQRLPAPCDAANNGSTGATLLPPRKAMLLRFAASQQLAVNSATTGKEIISQTVENDHQTVKSNRPHNASATSGQTTSENRIIPDNATNALTVVKDPSGASGSGLVASGLNVQELFQPGGYVEALSQDSGLRGCWFVCNIKKTTPKKDCIQVIYEDVPNAEGTGKLTEWIKLKRIAGLDPLGIRLAERPMVRPHVRQPKAITSEALIGTMVDARWNNGWWEGILLKHELDDRVKVYFPGEKKVMVLHKSDLRRSFEWMGNVWMSLSARDDVARQMNRRIEVGPSQLSGQGAKPAGTTPKKKGLLMQSKVSGKRDAKQAGKKKVRLQSSKGDEQFSVPPGITILESMTDSSRKVPGKAEKPAAKKEGHGISVDDMSPEGSQVCLSDFLKSDKLNWAARKARPRNRGSSGGLGHSGGSKLQGQEDINPSACDGDVAGPVNSVPDHKGKGVFIK